MAKVRKYITFTEKDLKKNYTNRGGCSIFNAMKRAGIPVYSVVSGSAILTNGKMVCFSSSLRKVNDILANANDGCLQDDQEITPKKKALIGKRFLVEYETAA